MAEEQETLSSENRLSTRKNNVLSMHERRKSISSALVIWYTVFSVRIALTGQTDWDVVGREMMNGKNRPRTLLDTESA